MLFDVPVQALCPRSDVGTLQSDRSSSQSNSVCPDDITVIDHCLLPDSSVAADRSAFSALMCLV